MNVLYRYQLYYDLVPDPETFNDSMYVAGVKEVQFLISKETKATYLFIDLKGKLRRVRKGVKNSYAHDNKPDALRCFYHRTLRHKSIMIGKADCLKVLLKRVLNENKSIIYNKENGTTDI